MIQVTLTFPSLAAAMAGLSAIPTETLVEAPRAAAVIADTKLTAHTAALAAAVEAEQEPAAAGKPAATPARTRRTAEAAAAVAAPVPTAPAPAPSAAAPAEASPPASTAAIDYTVLQKAVFELASKSRDAAAAVVQSFGVKTFKDLDKARWGEALAAVQAKSAEL